MTPEPCGCRIEFYKDGAPLGIIYCPTHDAAPDLLAALERIADRSWDEATVDGRNVAEMVHVARAAIAQAKGEVRA